MNRGTIYRSALSMDGDSMNELEQLVLARTTNFWEPSPWTVDSSLCDK